MGDLADHRVGGVGQEDTEDDVELDQADQATTHASGRNLSGVDRRDHGRQAHANAAEETEHHEEGDREGGRGRHSSIRTCDQCGQRGQRGRQSTNAEEDTDPEQDWLTAEAVGEVTGDDGTADRTDGCDGDDHALTQGGQSVQLGKFFFRTGNDRRVKAEEQAAERGNDGASNDQRRNGCVLC